VKDFYLKKGKGFEFHFDQDKYMFYIDFRGQFRAAYPHYNFPTSEEDFSDDDINMGISRARIKFGGYVGRPEYNFYSYPHVINNGVKPLRDMETIIDDIIWIIPDSRMDTVENWDSLKMMKLLYTSKRAPISIVDIGTSIGHESVDSILTSADMILAVVNPQLVELKQNKERLDLLLKLKKEKPALLEQQ